MKRILTIGLSVVLLCSSLVYAADSSTLPGGNTGDLTLENGAVLWPEVSEAERKEMEEKEYELMQQVRKGNTGDLTLEDGAILWPKMHEGERLEKERKEKEIVDQVKDPRYQAALKASEKAEEEYNKTGKALSTDEKKSTPFSEERGSFEAGKIYQNIRNVPVRRQETTYYGGVATVKQLDDYFNGERYTQKQIAGYLGTTFQGTDFSRVKQFLRDYVKSGYVLSSIGSFDNWHRIVVSSIDNNRPAVLDISTDGIDSFEYHTTGHILNVSGYRFGSVPNEVQVTDPHYKFSGTKVYPAHDLYRANQKHFRQQIIH